jgi:GDP-D-mannose dehydratase
MRALICGVTGQDGSLLTKFLLEKGYEVIGTSRDAQVSSFSNLLRLKIDLKKIKLVSMAPNDFRSVLQVVKRYEPNEIYNLSGQSSVGLSFDQPVETLESIASATHNFLEVLTMRALASVLELHSMMVPMSRRHSDQVVHTVLQNLQHIGRWQITGRHMVLRHVLVFCSITNRF